MKTPHPLIDHIKRQAKRIKKAEGLQHCHALEKAAKEAGFQTYRHALNQSKKGIHP